MSSPDKLNFRPQLNSLSDIRILLAFLQGWIEYFNLIQREVYLLSYTRFKRVGSSVRPAVVLTVVVDNIDQFQTLAVIKKAQKSFNLKENWMF